LHVLYSYDDNSVVVVNSLYEKFSGLTVVAHVYDNSLHETFSREVKADVDADGIAKVLTLPAKAFSPGSPLYFVKLALQANNGKTVSTNFYWLSPKKNVYEWGKTDYKFTPVSSYEDLTALQNLPKTKLEAGGTSVSTVDGPEVHLTLKNPGEHLAFQVRFGVRKKGQDMEILPVFWEDNYIELMPGESREINAKYLPTTDISEPLEMTVAGWNIETITIPLQSSATPSAQGAGSGR
jgi:exo-1,4-beta-D-glucosaminidase